MFVCTLAVVAWLSMYIGAAVMAIVGARKFAAKARASATGVDVALLRPCAGDEKGLAQRLAQTAGATHVVFALPSPADSALPAMETAAARLRVSGVDVQILQLSTTGPNRKAEQMAAAARAAALDSPARPMVFVDSDVDLTSVDLATLVAPLVDPSIGATWAPPIEAGARATAGDARSHAVLATTLHAFPLLAPIDPRGMVGKLFATTKTAIDRAGGLDELRLYIGEDMELARRLRLAGLRVVTAPLLAPSFAEGRSTADVSSRYLRWLQMVRTQRPLLLLSYPLLIAAGPAFALLALLAPTTTIRSFALAGLFTRLAIAFFAHRATRSSLPLGWLPFAAFQGDFVLLSACIRALVTRDLTWRGVSLRLGPHGRLAPPS